MICVSVAALVTFSVTWSLAAEPAPVPVPDPQDLLPLLNQLPQLAEGQQPGDKQPALPMGPQLDLAAKLRAAAGREVFEHKWQAQDSLSPAGDGLGPRFNAASCVDCHKQGGVGGGGPIEHDVELVTLVAAKNTKKNEITERFQLLSGGPGSTIILHKSSHEPEWETIRLAMYGIKRPLDKLTDAKKAQEWAKIAAAMKQQQGQPVRQIETSEASLRISRRQTPALFGLGQIDGIPDKVLREQAVLQTKSQRGISGRVGLASPERRNPYFDQQKQIDKGFMSVEVVQRAGKFGWRGQIGSLREFVLSACANELGLETPAHKQPSHPTKADYKSPGLDIVEDQCESLVSFVARLPQPMQIMPKDPERAAVVHQGESLFHKIGCAECHVKRLGDVDQLYSDLLLHDLGGDLADPVPAAPDGSQFFGGGYFGGGIDLAQARQELFREWRTPPLWGVRDSAPYLHDGRAADLPTAIKLHGGEATQVTTAYRRLPKNDQDALLTFLGTLAAPEDAPK
jgi:CxxC motif-containing protein (DUF1111 family)